MSDADFEHLRANGYLGDRPRRAANERDVEDLKEHLSAMSARIGALREEIAQLAPAPPVVPIEAMLWRQEIANGLKAVCFLLLLNLIGVGLIAFKVFGF